ncbi:MAG TPA: glucosamine-6-phosphate deaminase [Planctomycetota bacterium]|nr:glucosamine-6-phosphate deaminase [Planctomycetota bacterium]
MPHPVEAGGVRVEVCADAAEACRRAADRVAGVIRDRAAAAGAGAQRPATLALATGRSMERVYAELVRQHRHEGLSFRGVTSFNLDEYWPISPDDPASFRSYMREHLFAHVDLEPAGAHLPDGEAPRERLAEHCADYERAIRAAGGLDLALLGLGLNGHIAYNEPGSGPDSRTRLVELASESRARSGGGEGGPRHAVSMGIGTIFEARAIVLLAYGAEKSAIVAAALRGPQDAAVPASFLQRHRDLHVLLDRAAAAGLPAGDVPSR